MSRVINIKVPDSFDNDWLVKQLRDLDFRLEELVESEDDEERFNKLGACLDIVNAVQEYAGY
ncbi:hypothetical protein [Salmonella phage NINP13076]|uniref:Uncharacterized protein n=1 Tax=Salmonella phage SalP219 TaxID=3158864 RepID=A0AAU7PIJ2_9CAUD|nr:hypothetical protein [Salmonella phage NINP13076]